MREHLLDQLTAADRAALLRVARLLSSGQVTSSAAH
jgi:hypothetical protein